MVQYQVDDDDIVSSQRRLKINPCALLIYSVRLRALSVTAQSILRHLVTPLKCDIFIVGRRDDHLTESLCRKVFAGHLKSLLLESQLEPEAMGQILKGAKRYEALQVVCGQSNMLHPGTLNGLRWLEKGYHHVVEYEEARAARYKWLIYLRPDFEFLVDAPPLAKMAPDRLHFPTRTPWGGVPAGFVVAPRDLAGVWGQMWSLLLNGTMVDTIASKPNMLTIRNCAASEMFEWTYLQMAQVKIGWFSSIAALRCVKNLCQEGDQCHKGVSPCSHATQKFKYQGPTNWYEDQVALLNAQRIAKLGWTLPTEFSYNSPFNRTNIRPYWDSRSLYAPLTAWGNWNAIHPEPPFSPLDPF